MADHQLSTMPQTLTDSRPDSTGARARRWLATVGPTFGIFGVVALLVIAGAVMHERCFLHPINIRNILAVSTPIAILGLGMAFVLFAGEIDLSVGSTLSIASVILGTFMAKEAGMIVPVALLALAAGALVGAINATMVRLGVPAFWPPSP